MRKQTHRLIVVTEDKKNGNARTCSSLKSCNQSSLLSPYPVGASTACTRPPTQRMTSSPTPKSLFAGGLGRLRTKGPPPRRAACRACVERVLYLECSLGLPICFLPRHEQVRVWVLGGVNTAWAVTQSLLFQELAVCAHVSQPAPRRRRVHSK